MTLVFQVRLTAAEAQVARAHPATLDQIAITMAVTMETAGRVSDKPITGEIVDDKGSVLQTVP